MKALLVDGFNLVRRIYAAVPAPRPEHETEHPNSANHASLSHIQGVIRSSVSSLQRALRHHQPSHCVAVFEQSGRTWRHRLFPDYKKNRSAMPEDLAKSMPELKAALMNVGMNSFDKIGYEADDVIATMATKIARNHGHVVILSTDRNHCQLIHDFIQIYDHFGQRYLDREMVRKRFDVEPEQLPFLLALAGESSVSIPGIPSIGLRTAARLVNEYQTMDKLLDASGDMAGKIGNKLYNGKDTARLGLELFTLKTDIPLGVNLNHFRFQHDL